MKVTQQPLRRGLKILPRHVIWPFILVVSVEVGLLIAWSATGTSKYGVMKNSDNTIEPTSGYCATIPFYTKPPSKQILIALIVLLSIVQFVLIILTYKIRKINQELGDSKRILWLILFQFILNIGCFFIAPYTDDKILLVYAIQYTITSISTVAFMILPRMYYVWFEHQHGHFPENVVMIGGGTTTVRGVNPGTGNGTGVTSPPIIRNNDNNDDRKNHDDNDNKNVNNNSKVLLTTAMTLSTTTVLLSTTTMDL